jgi:hypothetical protein
VVLVNITFEFTSMSGVRYTLETFRTTFIVGGCGATVPR